MFKPTDASFLYDSCWYIYYIQIFIAVTLSEKDKMCIKKAGAYNYCYILFILPNHYNQNNGWDFLY